LEFWSKQAYVKLKPITATNVSRSRWNP